MFACVLSGAVLSVTYALAVATGIAYLQHADVDSGRNIFNIGFTMFMSLALPRWFRLHHSFIQTGAKTKRVFSSTVCSVLLLLIYSCWFGHLIERIVIFFCSGVASVDVLLQSLVTLPVFFVGVLAFLLEHTVSGKTTEKCTIQKIGVGTIFGSLLSSPRLHLFDQKHNEYSNIMKYYYNLKCSLQCHMILQKLF